MRNNTPTPENGLLTLESDFANKILKFQLQIMLFFSCILYRKELSKLLWGTSELRLRWIKWLLKAIQKRGKRKKR